MRLLLITGILTAIALSPLGGDDAGTRYALQAAEGKAQANFAAVGKAFLQKHCNSCHGAVKPKADLSLHVYTDDASVLKDRKKWEPVLAMVISGEMPPKERPRPSAVEIDQFVSTVKAIFDHADKNAPRDPGRVTVRRLNKVEYNNTVRDLLGVDFNASEDFPSDDVGHGFDNIGDVLTLSPVLMERYLDAAETIANRAVAIKPPPPPVRYVNAEFLEPAGNFGQKRFRTLTEGGDKGRLHTAQELTVGGDYILAVRCYAQQAGDEPARIALEMDGKTLKTFDIKSTDEKNPETFQFRLPITPGAHRAAVQFLNPFKKDKDERKVFVRSLRLEGPMDTRSSFQRQYLHYEGKQPPDAQQTAAIISRFVARAYRRPADKNEVARLTKLVETTVAKGGAWETGIQLVLQAVLVSPKFLFRLELDGGSETNGIQQLDDYQLASRLSYFIWSTMPDDELFALAEKKQLGKNLDSQVKRMLKDPKARALVDNFVMQWLQLRNLRNMQPDTKMFPSFNERLRSAMLKETELFFLEIIREDRRILDIIDADFTYLNGPLARHYGIIDTKGNTASTVNKAPGGKPIRDREREFERVSLQPGTRGGLLTQASILTVTSNPTRTSPVKRGRWVLEQMLGTPPPPPPPDVPELDADPKAAAAGSLRKRMEIHREKASCANCHAKMDPLGFAFENFNAVGAFRQKDGDFDIDPSGVLPDGQRFQGPDELKKILKEKKDLFSRCVAEKMLIYAVGRGLEHYDKRALDGICQNLAANNYKFSSLVAEVVKSDPFRLKRGKGQAPDAVGLRND